MASSRRPRRPYHHGNLREALLAAAERAVDEGGVGALALRKLAARAEVTHAAAYHHFADRDALLRALAARGFESLSASLEEGQRRGEGLLGFLEMGVAYVSFAMGHPGLFRLMFGPEVAAGRARDAALRASADRAFEILVSGARVATAADAGEEAVRRVALGAWSTVHGLASLLLDDQLAHLGLRVRDHERIAREMLMSFRSG